MDGKEDNNAGPLVTLAIYAGAEGGNLPAAIRSAVGQTHRNLDIVVCGELASDSKVQGINDSRIRLFPSDCPLHPAAAMNIAFSASKGKLIAYMDGNTILYPDHISSLLETLRDNDDAQAAYGLMYKTYYQKTTDGVQVLSKMIEDDRDPDQFSLCYHNHIPLAGLCHSRRLIEQAGPFNESLGELFDWDLIRRLSFYTRIAKMEKITGETLIRVQKQSPEYEHDNWKYLRNVLSVRTARPPKPWAMMPDLSIIFNAPRMDPSICRALRQIWIWTLVPYQTYLPVGYDEQEKFSGDMSNLVTVAMPPDSPQAAKIDEGVRCCDGDYVAIVPHDLEIGPLWLEAAYFSMLSTTRPKVAFALGQEGLNPLAAVYRRTELLTARLEHPALSLRRSVEESGITLCRPAPASPTWRKERLLADAFACQARGDWDGACEAFDSLLDDAPSTQIRQLAAAVFCRVAGRQERSLEVIKQVNTDRPSVQSLLLEAQLLRRRGDANGAISLLERAEEELRWKE